MYSLGIVTLFISKLVPTARKFFPKLTGFFKNRVQYSQCYKTTMWKNPYFGVRNTADITKELIPSWISL